MELNFLTVEDIAEMVDKDTTTIARWSREGRIPGAIKAGQKWLFPTQLKKEDINEPKMGRPEKA